MEPDKKNNASQNDIEENIEDSPHRIHPAKSETIPPSPNQNNTCEHCKKSPNWFNRVRLVLEILTFLIALCVIFFAYNTWQEIKSQTPAIIKATNIANQNLQVTQRAYLTTKDPIIRNRANPLDIFAIEIPIENYGHIATTFSGELKYSRKSLIDTFNITFIDTIKSGEVLPGITYTLMVTIPRLSEQDKLLIEGGKQTIGVFGLIDYDTGFGETDGFVIGVYYHAIYKKWMRTDWATIVDFRNKPK